MHPSLTPCASDRAERGRPGGSRCRLGSRAVALHRCNECRAYCGGSQLYVQQSIIISSNQVIFGRRCRSARAVASRNRRHLQACETACRMPESALASNAAEERHRRAVHVRRATEAALSAAGRRGRCEYTRGYKRRGSSPHYARGGRAGGAGAPAKQTSAPPASGGGILPCTA